jgi:hypothetical protein
VKNVIITLLAIAILWFVIFSCKKNKAEPFKITPASVTMPHINKMSAKINNSDWVLALEKNRCSTVISNITNNYSFSGRSSFENPYTLISVNFIYSTGIIYFGKGDNLLAHYWDAKGTCFTSRTGTVNITELDTIAHNGSGLTKFSATFSFNTDTIQGKSYQITSGIIDYKNK